MPMWCFESNLRGFTNVCFGCSGGSLADQQGKHRGMRCELMTWCVWLWSRRQNQMSIASGCQYKISLRRVGVLGFAASWLRCEALLSADSHVARWLGVACRGLCYRSHS